MFVNHFHFSLTHQININAKYLKFYAEFIIYYGVS